jgi:hypothetical protein
MDYSNSMYEGLAIQLREKLSETSPQISNPELM